jgi:hypothetical protein
MKPRLHLLTFLFSAILALAARPIAALIPVAGEGSGPSTIFLPLVAQGGSAPASISTLPTLADFIASVADGQAGVARGVYVGGTLALTIEQQPSGDAAYITSSPDAVSQFQSAAYFGVTGLLAHNSLAGAQFFELGLGQEVQIVYGDGSIRAYRITAQHRFQALDPYNPNSNFVDLDTGATLSALEVFNQVYTGGDQVTFQTCIAQNGLSTWGRLFVIATPVEG